VRELHARIGNLNKTVRKEKQKLRRSPDELEEKVAKLRRTEAEKLNQRSNGLHQIVDKGEPRGKRV
jgi:hypothetical protein